LELFSKNKMNPYTSLAKSAVETYINKGKIIDTPQDLPEDFLKKRAGVFVTLEKKGKLRGCIGTYLPTKINIAEEIIYNAIAAATEDHRFPPVQKEELPFLSYTVYVLSEPKLVKDIKELDPKRYGIIVKTSPFVYPNQKIAFDNFPPFKSGLLLPDLPGIDTPEQQISIACQKGGINPTKEKIFIYKFKTEKYQ